MKGNEVDTGRFFSQQSISAKMLYSSLDGFVDSEFIQYTDNLVHFLADILAGQRGEIFSHEHIADVKNAFHYMIEKFKGVTIIPSPELDLIVGFNVYKELERGTSYDSGFPPLDVIINNSIVIPNIYISDMTSRMFFRGNDLSIQYSKGRGRL